MASYDFSEAFTDKIVALLLRDSVFAESTNGLIKPEYFDRAATSYLANLSIKYFETYRCTPSAVTVVELLRQAITNKRLRPDLLADVKTKFSELLKSDISDRQFVIDQVVAFAKHRAMQVAILNAADVLQKSNDPEYGQIEDELRKALAVGAIETTEYDYFEEAQNRAATRKEQLAGNIKPTGVTTGCMEIDSRLHHKGFGRQEMSVYMGASKVGKSFSLIYSAVSAALAGYSVLYVTLENSREITTERMDAYLSGCLQSQLKIDADNVAAKVEASRNGRLKIHQYAMNTWSPNDANRLIQHYKSQGVQFDELVVDYLDLMVPNIKSKDDPIENSRNLWQDMRAIAQRENIALVSATQTNRDGVKAGVADMTHVADDFNKIRIADLVISINRDENEKRQGRARLFFAASRNQESELTIEVNQDLSRARFITSVISVS